MIKTGYVCMATYEWLRMAMFVNVCMAMYKCMYDHAYMVMNVWLCMHGYECMAMYVWLCMHGYECMAMYVCISMYVCMYVCLCMYVRLCMSRYACLAEKCMAIFGYVWLLFAIHGHQNSATLHQNLLKIIAE